MTAPTGQASWLLRLLRRVQLRPGAYLGDDRLNSLSCYVEGVFIGFEEAGVAANDERAFLRSFGDWLGKRGGWNNGDCWWFLTCQRNGAPCPTSDFFDALDEFLIERGYSGGLNDTNLELEGWPTSSGRGSD